MKLNELKEMMAVELRNGTKGFIMGGNIMTNNAYIRLSNYSDNMKHFNDSNMDIMKVYVATEEEVQQGMYYYKNNLSNCIYNREQEENIALNQVEKTLLLNIDNKFKYIARDNNNELGLYEVKPIKDTHHNIWSNFNQNINVCMITAFNHLFNFVKWENEEPILIEDLLKEKGKEVK